VLHKGLAAGPAVVLETMEFSPVSQSSWDAYSSTGLRAVPSMRTGPCTRIPLPLAHSMYPCWPLLRRPPAWRGEIVLGTSSRQSQGNQTAHAQVRPTFPR
jgi:hypothetical protein